MTYYLGMFMIIAGSIFVVPFTALVAWETWRALTGKVSIFNRYTPPPKPAPPRHA